MYEREVTSHEGKEPLNEVNIGHKFVFEGWEAEVIGILKYKEDILYVLKNTDACNEIKVTIHAGKISAMPIKGDENLRRIKTFEGKDKYQNLCDFLEVFFK